MFKIIFELILLIFKEIEKGLREIIKPLSRAIEKMAYFWRFKIFEIL